MLWHSSDLRATRVQIATGDGVIEYSFKMTAFDAVDGASSAASKWYRMIASKPERFKEVMPGNEMAFEVFKELARTRRRNADTVDPGIGRTRLGQRTLKCVFLIGTRSAHSIRASGLTAAQTGRTHDRTRPMLQCFSESRLHARSQCGARNACQRGPLGTAATACQGSRGGQRRRDPDLFTAFIDCICAEVSNRP